MAGVGVKIPGIGGKIEAKKARLAAAVERAFNVVTAAPEKKMQGKQAGATGWLVKPFNPEKLLATIAKVL